MGVVSMVVGAVTDTSARFVTKVDAGGPVRVAVAADAAMTAPTYSAATTVDSHGVAKVELTGLDPDTRYWWRVEDAGTLDGTTGQLVTDPAAGQAASFTIGLGGDAGLDPDYPGVAGDAPERLSNHPVHSTIRNRALNEGWRRFVHLGDICYYDLGSGNHGLSAAATADQYRSMWDDILAQPSQAALYRDVPWVYMWDDHDFGPNNSDSTSPGRDNAVTVYRERIPHYDLGSESATGAVYHSFQIGRVLFVVSDTRADRAGSTMLGAEQKSWLNGVLGASDAELLVWLMPTPWIGLASDTWAGYTGERSELVQLLDERGWLGRMCMVSADKHVLALESGDGGNISHGGFPIMLCAALDASPGSLTDQYDVGMRAGRNQYGTLTVDDAGDIIHVTLTGWVGEEQWESFTFSVVTSTPSEPPEVPTGPAPVARARIRRRIGWYGVHAVTGRIIAELPDVEGRIGRMLSDYASHELTMPLPLAGPGHIPIELVEQATQPVTTAIVAVVNDIPVWQGWVLSRRGGTGPTLRLATVTPEGYLRRRRVRDHSYEATDRALVAAGILDDAGDLAGGAGLGFTLDVELTGDEIDREYVASDRLTVHDALRELCAGGLEYTVDLDWADSDMTSVRRILRIGPRVGVARDVPPLLETVAGGPVLESRAGAETRYELLEDATAGRYANHVTVVAPGEGEDQPASTPAVDTVALAGGAPVVEDVVDVSSADTTQGTLDDLAESELALRRRGARVWDLTSRLDSYPRLGVDLMLGDDIAWRVVGHRHPTGVSGTGRMIGYEVDHRAGTWRPVLMDPQEA